MAYVVPPGHPLTMGDVATDSVVAGVDVGGTRTKLALLDAAGDIVLTEILPRREARGSDPVEAVIERLAGLKLQALGLALPGLVEPTFGSRDLPGKLPGLSGRPVVAELSARLRIPVVCLNDGQAAVIGEWQAGAGRGCDDLILVTLGTGVGSGVIMRGQPLMGGWLGVGNAIGHISFDADGDRCLCGNVGCPETRVSATAVTAAARAHLARGVPSTLARQERRLTFEHIVLAAAAGDPLATELIDRFVRDLGVMLVSGVHAYGASAIVLAGGMALAVTAYLPEIQAYLEAHTWRFPRDRPVPLMTAALGDFSGAVGAAFEASRLRPGSDSGDVG